LIDEKKAYSPVIYRQTETSVLDDIHNFAMPSLRPAEAIQMTYIFFSLAVFWLHFGTLKGPNGFLAFLVPRLRPKTLKINWGNPQKVLRKTPYQLAVFWPKF